MSHFFLTRLDQKRLVMRESKLIKWFNEISISDVPNVGGCSHCKGLSKLDIENLSSLRKCGHDIRQLVLHSELPEPLSKAIESAYRKLGEKYFENPDVAVRRLKIFQMQASLASKKQKDHRTTLKSFYIRFC